MSNVIGKAVQLLHALIPNENEKEWSATEISKRVDMPVQTVHRLLLSLAEHGLVYKNKKTRKFRLGLSLMQLGFMVWENISIRAIAHPIMEQLAKKTRESVYLTVREGSSGVFVESVDSPQMLRITEPIGMRLPLYIGASKKVILAYLPEKIQNQLLNEFSFQTRTSTTVRSRDQLMKELVSIRQNGYAISYGETTEGTAGIAAPIFSWDNHVVAAISIAGPETRFKTQSLKEMIVSVRKAAVRISEELGWIKSKSII